MEMVLIKSNQHGQRLIDVNQGLSLSVDQWMNADCCWFMLTNLNQHQLTSNDVSDVNQG